MPIGVAHDHCVRCITLDDGVVLVFMVFCKCPGDKSSLVCVTTCCGLRPLHAVAGPDIYVEYVGVMPGHLYHMCTIFVQYAIPVPGHLYHMCTISGEYAVPVPGKQYSLDVNPRPVTHSQSHCSGCVSLQPMIAYLSAYLILCAVPSCVHYADVLALYLSLQAEILCVWWCA